ncbi:MAG: hypothetical protein RLZZ371_2802 [Pseudomonadota bacterium]
MARIACGDVGECCGGCFCRRFVVSLRFERLLLCTGDLGIRRSISHFGFVGVELGLLPEALLQALPLRIFGIMQNDTLLAIPFFTLRGLILERSGMAEDLLDTIGQLFGPLRGGLAFAVIFVGALLAATTGVVAASVISMGLISLPIMLRYGYDRRVASGVIAASGTLAQIIPPSLVLIILADQLGRSVGEMYKGAFIPGFALTAMYVGYVVLLTFIRPSWVPALPAEARTIREDNGSSGLPSLGILTLLSAGLAITLGQNYAQFLSWFIGESVLNPPTDETIVVALCAGVILAFVIALINKVTRLGLLSRMAERVTFVLIPPLLLIFLVLGTIFLGVATPTEGGAMGAMGALLMALARKRLDMSLMKQALNTTAKLSSFVVFILVGSTVFSLVFQGVDGSKGFLITVNLLIFFLAFFLDFFELSFIVVPLLAPVAEKMGIDLIWFGVLLGVNMQTSFMHPPFGFALFYLRSVAPAKAYTDKLTKKLIQPVTTMQIYWGAIPFVIIQIVMVGLIIAFPGIVSSGLDKAEVVDLDKVGADMMRNMSDTPSEAQAPAIASDASAPNTLTAPAPDAPADDDPMKALEESMKKK